MELFKYLNRKNTNFIKKHYLILSMTAATCLKSRKGATKGWKSCTQKKKTGGTLFGNS